jgi:hypothetical protein
MLLVKFSDVQEDLSSTVTEKFSASSQMLSARQPVEHGLTTTHHWMTAEAQRIHGAGRSTRPNRSAGVLGLGKTPLRWWHWASPASACASTITRYKCRA